ncbi:beta carbonic anhydrase clade D [Mollisia scopiformis]|uniref:Carbonic anhydrase n=1 Tax=Mollisia scopiformis TaxID=149040 RepID=A0A194XSR6_MOLSC|nr:beta carbonic anhydrase clade D [Mollisia scopiformis]KUJ22772.1 beta carbonic anhydrase clade D [Mollisia scopiformis]
MAPTQLQENLVKANEKYASSFTEGHLALPPAKKYAIVTCMDARIDPAAAFGITLGDAHIIRNAGGVAKDALRSLVISEQLLGTQEILIIKHTGCGMLTFQNRDAVGVVQSNLGVAGVEAIRSGFGSDFLPFPDLEGAVKSDVEWLKANTAIPVKIEISGWIYEVETGKVRHVV